MPSSGSCAVTLSGWLIFIRLAWQSTRQQRGRHTWKKLVAVSVCMQSSNCAVGMLRGRTERRSKPRQRNGNRVYSKLYAEPTRTETCEYDSGYAAGNYGSEGGAFHNFKLPPARKHCSWLTEDFGQTMLIRNVPPPSEPELTIQRLHIPTSKA